MGIADRVDGRDYAEIDLCEGSRGKCLESAKIWVKLAILGGVRGVGAEGTTVEERHRADRIEKGDGVHRGVDLLDCNPVIRLSVQRNHGRRTKVSEATGDPVQLVGLPVSRIDILEHDPVRAG